MGKNDVILDFEFDSGQVVINAGACHAQSGVDFEQGIMCGTLDESFIHIKKLVFQPIKIGTRMRAAINESMESTIFMDNEESKFAPLVINIETLATGIINFRGFAQFN